MVFALLEDGRGPLWVYRSQFHDVIVSNWEVTRVLFQLVLVCILLLLTLGSLDFAFHGRVCAWAALLALLPMLGDRLVLLIRRVHLVLHVEDGLLEFGHAQALLILGRTRRSLGCLLRWVGRQEGGGVGSSSTSQALVEKPGIPGLSFRIVLEVHVGMFDAFG